MWMAHECAPKNFTAVDVTDPSKPQVIAQTDLPHRNVRSNSLEVCDNIMAVAYQTGTHGAHAGRHRAVRHLQARGAAQHQLHRPFRTAVARCAPALVRRWQDDPLLVRRAGFHAAQPARTTSATRRSTSAIRPSRASWDGGGTRHRGTRRRAARSYGIRSSIRVGGPTIQTSIQSDRTVPMSATSMAARASSTLPISAGRSWWDTGTRIRHFPASRTPSCRCSTATCWW